jgi:hypothetical protein
VGHEGGLGDDDQARVPEGFADRQREWALADTGPPTPVHTAHETALGKAGGDAHALWGQSATECAPMSVRSGLARGMVPPS